MSTSTTAVKPDFRPALWTPGDWNVVAGILYGLAKSETVPASSAVAAPAE